MTQKHLHSASEEDQALYRDEIYNLCIAPAIAWMSCRRLEYFRRCLLLFLLRLSD